MRHFIVRQQKPSKIACTKAWWNCYLHPAKYNIKRHNSSIATNLFPEIRKGAHLQHGEKQHLCNQVGRLTSTRSDVANSEKLVHQHGPLANLFPITAFTIYFM